MRCGGRTILEQWHFGDVSVVEALYRAGSVDPLHSHDDAHLSIIIEGEAIEVRDCGPLRQSAGALVSQRAQIRHAIHFPVATRVATIVVPAFAMPDALLLNNHVDESEKPAWLQKILRSFPWASSTPLREASRVARLSHTHFDRTFRRYVGTSPRVFRRRAKVAAASRMLLESQMTLAELSLAAGFSDQSHLTAVFSKTIGMTPAQYRRIFR